MFLSNLLKNNDITTIKNRLNANKTDEMLILILKRCGIKVDLSDNIFISTVKADDYNTAKQEEIHCSVSQSKEIIAAIFLVLQYYSIEKTENI